jgi:hypothetical protein
MPKGEFWAGVVIDKCFRDRFGVVFKPFCPGCRSRTSPAKQHEGFIEDDSHQPRGEAGPLFKVLQVQVGALKAFLYDILRVLPISGYLFGHAQSPVLVAENQPIESISIAAFGGSYQ